MAGFGKVVVVTGASRGVGYGIGRELAMRMPGACIYLTTRQANLDEMDQSLKCDIGVAAHNASFRFMDQMDRRSIKRFVDNIKKKHKRLDILINNASVYHKPPHSLNQDDILVHIKQVEEMVKINYGGLKNITEAFTSALNKDARIINISSHLAQLKVFDQNDPKAVKLYEAFTDPDLTVDNLDNLVKSYANAVKSGSWLEEGWPDCAYSVTKIAVNCYTHLLQKEFDKLYPQQNIMINAVCPGTQHSKMKLTEEETISVDDAADTISYLATLKMSGVGEDKVPRNMVPRGKFLWHDLTPMNMNVNSGFEEDERSKISLG